MKKLLVICLALLIFLFGSLTYVSAARLPTVGGDSDNWGTVLNEYLQGILGDNATSISVGNFTFSSNLSFYNFSGSEKLTITDEGNVGIGTSNPSDLLHISGGNIKIQSDSAKVQFYNTVGSTRNAYIQGSGDNLAFIQEGANYFRFVTNGGEKVRIDSVGNVGINTTSPTAVLEVNGDEIVGGKIDFTGHTANEILIQVSGNAITDSANSVTYTDGLFKKTSGEGSFVGIGPNTAASVYNAAVVGDTGRRLVFTAGGLLQFGSGAGATDTTLQRVSGGGLAITGGNVGIGTTSPSEKLVVQSTAYDVARFNSSNSAGTRILLDASGVGGEKWAIQSAGSGSSNGAGQLVFNAAGEVDMVINSTSGNVGIGTTAPQYKLSFGSYNDAIGVYTDATHNANIQLYSSSDGAMSFNQYHLSSGGFNFNHDGSRLVTILPSGNVGINTTTPTTTLEVDGNASITGNVTMGEWLYVEGTVDADAYLEHSAVYDVEQYGSALDYVENSSEIKTPEGEYNHTADPSFLQVNVTVVDESTGQTTQEVRSSLSDKVAWLRQATYELKEENIQLKSAICKKDDSYYWCSELGVAQEVQETSNQTSELNETTSTNESVSETQESEEVSETETQETSNETSSITETNLTQTNETTSEASANATAETETNETETTQEVSSNESISEQEEIPELEEPEIETPPEPVEEPEEREEIPEELPAEPEETPVAIVGNVIKSLLNSVSNLFLGMTGQVSLESENTQLKREITQLKELVCSDHPDAEICEESN